jgi:hypothetical protein
MIRNMNKKDRQHATIPLIFINKTISFYLQYVFDRIIFLLPGQLTGAAVDVEVVDAEVVVLFSMVCMWTPWARTARIMEVNVHSMVGGRTGTERLSYQHKFFSGLSLFTSWDFPLICRYSLCFNFDE